MKESRKCIKRLIDHSPHTLNWQDYEGRTPLHLAVTNEATGTTGNCQLLLKSKYVTLFKIILSLDTIFYRCQVDVTDHASCSALHLAAGLSKSLHVSLLLHHKADAGLRDRYGATALHHATFAGCLDTVETLMRHPDVNDEPDCKGRTALMWAAAIKDRDEVIQVLCRHGANLEHK